ncbi:C40 family peptidase [Halalkalibacillus halophilus]|uniref:C40 family peptidase n=1 Tax=Halalkalibacillus halophilus TaxID=392827 RepID=UPI000414A4B5|nr:C40 family peptidase [Halalkalibacillus halophilus]
MPKQPTTYVVDVPVATIWTEPESPREIDHPGTLNPMDLDTWYDQMSKEERLALAQENLVQSQLLYGEEVIVDEVKNSWAKVIAIKQPSKKDPRGYPGWVPMIQLKEVSIGDWYREKIALIEKKTAILYDLEDKPLLNLSYLTYLPVIEEKAEDIVVQAPQGEAIFKKADVSIHDAIRKVPNGDGKSIVKVGEQFLGLDYFWGGMSAFGYDCSGFAYNMHKVNGYEIPRDATDQAKDGEEVPLDQLETGDLIFFAYEEGKGNIHHVGIYYGDGKMIHSPSTGKGIEIIELAGTKYETELCAARRYYQSAGDA